MENIDLPSIYAQLQEMQAVPMKFGTQIAEKSGINHNSVYACLTGNPRVYVSDDAKAKVVKAAIQILSEHSAELRRVIIQLNGLISETPIVEAS